MKQKSNPAIDSTVGYRIFGALAARCLMFLLGNGKTGFEKREYTDLSELADMFDKAVGGNNTRPEPKVAPTMEAKATASVASLLNVSDPKWIANQKGFIATKLFSMKSGGGARVFELTEFSNTGVQFEEKTTFGGGSTLQVPYTDLGMWSEFKGTQPTVVPDPSIDRGVESAPVQFAYMQCSVFNRLVEVATKHKASEKEIAYVLGPYAIHAKQDLAKGSLTFVPLTDGPTKLTKKEQSVSAAEVVYAGCKFQVEPPVKPTKANESEWPKNTVLVGFWWIGTTQDASLANMTLKTINEKDIKVTVAYNHRAIKLHEKLLRFKAKEDKAKVNPDSYAAKPKPPETEGAKSKGKGKKGASAKRAKVE